MRKMNRKLLLLLVAAFLLANATIVYAYTNHSTPSLINTFLPAHVDAEVDENFNGVAKTGVMAKNTSNIDAYLRLRVIAHWEDTKGNRVALGSDVVATENALPDFNYDSANWIRVPGTPVSNNDNNSGYISYTFYYKKPVAPGASVPLLLDGQSITLKKKTINYLGVKYEYNQVVTIIAEAIQSKPETTVENSWGVTIENGVITN